MSAVHATGTLTIDDVRDAEKRLAPYVRRTPVLQSVQWPEIFFKAESLQPTGSFKVRAAFNQLLLLSESERRRGVVTSSSGNFAQATAYAGHLLGISTKIVMMESANPIKIAGTRRWGGEIVFCEDRFEARQEGVTRVQQVEKRTLIHPFDHPAGVAGNGTAALEILEQCPDMQDVVVPVSGGGLLAAVAFTMKSIRPSARVWGVQSRGANAAYLSFQQGRLCSIDRADTIADGLTVTRPGDWTFPLIQAYTDQIVQVTEESIRQAVQLLWNEEKLVVEPSGAAGLAAVLEGQIEGPQTLLILSGGNLSPEFVPSRDHGPAGK